MDVFYLLVPHTSSTISFTKRSLAHCSAVVSLLPMAQEAKPHCGEYDFTLKIQTRDMESYQEFMRTKLGNIDSVGYFHSVFVMKEVKNTHGVPLK